MALMNRGHRWVFILAASIVAGCDCGGGTVASHAIPTLSVGDSQEASLEVTLDFGSVPFGASKSAVVTVRNSGREFLAVEGFGFERSASEAEPGASVFRIEAGERRVAPGSEVAWVVTFHPPGADEARPERFEDYAATIRVNFGNTREAERSATIQLRGRGIDHVCDVPGELNFGAVALGESRRLELVLTNPTLEPAKASLGAFESSSDAHLAFSLADGVVPGEHLLPAEASLRVPVDFAPTDVRPYFGHLKVRAANDCPDVTVSMLGSGVDQVLTWTPAVDCGYVPVGLHESVEIAFSNVGYRDALVTLSAISSEHFSLEGGPGALTVPAGGTATSEVLCQPQVPGLHASQATFTTDLPKQPSGAVQLEVFGAGPDIQVEPSAISFGKVAFIPSADHQPFQTRRFYVRNLGAPAPNEDPVANLHLGGSGGSYFELVAGPGTEADEFTVDPLTGYNPEFGIPAVVGRETLPVSVRVVPQSTGRKEATIRVFSNDLDEPVVEVKVVADAVELPPCLYSVSPTSLPFGIVQPPAGSELSFTLRNMGTLPEEVCLFSTLELERGTAAQFVLLDAAERLELGPGESKQVRVKLDASVEPPTTFTSIQGAVSFEASAPQAPVTRVELSGHLGSGCLIISPPAHDFGSVKTGCASQVRTFKVYNQCTADVTLAGLEVSGAAGLPGGSGAACPGPAPCPEFELHQPPPIPVGGVLLSPSPTPWTFDVRYWPIDDGPDSGSVTVLVTESNRNMAYTLPVVGEGAPAGTRIDVHQQPAVPMVDVLFVIEQFDACDAGTALPALQTTVGDFHDELVARGIDFHIGMTQSYRTPGGSSNGQPNPDCDLPLGELRPGFSHSERFITGTTLNPNAKLQDSLLRAATQSTTQYACTNGGVIFEAVRQAVMPPLVGQANSGFLRPDASFVVVSFSQVGDLSGPKSLFLGGSAGPFGQWPVSFYLDAFVNAKHGRKDLVSFSAVSRFDSTTVCGPNTDIGGRLTELASLTGGFTEEGCVCQPNWQSSFNQLALKIQEGHRSFPVSSVPDLSQQLVVRVDGSTLSNVNGQGAVVWEYDASDQWVHFPGAYVPPPGSTIAIEYQPVCH